MSRYLRFALPAAALLALCIGTHALASQTGNDSKSQVQADTLNGYQETPGVSSPGFGEFVATIDDEAQTIAYTLTYGGLKSPAFASQAQ